VSHCTICGKEELLPFVCRYCGHPFCAEHRLPESHHCSHLGAAVIPMKIRGRDASETYYARPTRFRTSRTELLHLAIGVGVLLILEAPGVLRFGVNILMQVAGVIVLAFALHELAHKLTAQHYGLWSEFRLSPLGTVLSLLTLFSPVKIIAPGAVVIFGSQRPGATWGKIALAGPLANILQLIAFTLLAPFSSVLGYAAVLNAELAVFNLLPLSVLDGRKVFAWSKPVWIVVFATAVLLGVLLQIRL
jgi:Zn-dependent protease